MNFDQWVVAETGMTWSQLLQTGTTARQRYRLYDDYSEYCRVNDVEEVF